MKKRISNQHKIKSYCRMVHEATSLGVSLDDILRETSKYHGDLFREQVQKKLTDYL